MNRPLTHLLSFAAIAVAGVAPHLASAADAASGPAHYAVHDRWQLGAPSHWDYIDIDPVRHRLYVTRGDHVDVLATGSGKLAGTIAHTEGVHGVAFAQDLKLGFTSNGRANSVTVFDLDTLQPRQEVKVAGVNPDAILYDPSTRKLYTFNGRSADVSVFDASTMRPLATIPVGGKPEFAAADGAGHVFVNVEDKGEIVSIDAHADRVLAHWQLKGCEEPTGLALDTAHRRLFSVCANRVMAVTDSASGKPVAQVAIGGHPDAAAYDASSATVFASNGEGSLSVVRQLDPDHYEAATVPTLKGARTMAFDHDSKTVYLPTVENQAFTVLVVKP